MEKATIKFASGGVIETEKNGSCFIIDGPFTDGIADDLSKVTVTDADGERTLHNVELIECYSVDGRYWFSFRELSERELMDIRTRADIEYIAMMADVEL